MKPVPTVRRWWVLTVVVGCMLVVFLDNTVLNVALPRLQQELGASQGEQEWAIAAYTVLFAALLLPGGVLGDRVGRRRVLLWGLLVFGLGSLASAYAPTPMTLVAMRAVTGAAAAAVVPATLSIITNVFDGRERGKAIAVWAGMGGVAVAVGPVVGGGLLDAGFWWGSVFLVNVPVVALGLVGARWLVPESRDPARPKLDPLGMALSVSGLLLLVYGIIRAGQVGDWTGAPSLVPVLVGAAVLVVFGIVESRTPHAALDLSWFRQPACAVACVASGLAMFALFGAMLYGMYFLQFDRGLTPLQAGLLMLGNAAAVVCFAPVSTVLVTHHGARRVCVMGLAVLATSYGAMTVVDHGTPMAVVALVLVLLGVGMANVIAPATELIMSSLPRERAGAGSAVNSTVRAVGGALGVAVLGSTLSVVYRSRISDALSALPDQSQNAASESIGGTQAVVAGGWHERIPDHGAALLQQSSDAFIDAMHVTAALSTASVLIALVVVAVWMPGGTGVRVPAGGSAHHIGDG